MVLVELVRHYLPIRKLQISCLENRGVRKKITIYFSDFVSECGEAGDGTEYALYFTRIIAPFLCRLVPVDWHMLHSYSLLLFLPSISIAINNDVQLLIRGAAPECQTPLQESRRVHRVELPEMRFQLQAG